MTDFVAGGPAQATSVGIVDHVARTIATRGEAGMLLYGPYLSLPPGSYIVRWRGSVRAPSTPLFEVFSVKSGIIKASPASLVSGGPADLKAIDFRLKTTTAGLEFRVIATAGDDFAISNILLTAVACDLS